MSSSKYPFLLLPKITEPHHPASIYLSGFPVSSLKTQTDELGIVGGVSVNSLHFTTITQNYAASDNLILLAIMHKISALTFYELLPADVIGS
ncbi:hypothetical protein CEXT_702351 [Caerostris extrusa]|uniref:Uncharacterized protein n=1 Tax=Caerostris extrusa TaxID=172846 RepID=A0AAV4N748_CAEEX|nr:hypothetical protein CEXT_702351 [Caerostris extrusa]